MPTLRIWWSATRPKTLSAAIAPILVGTAAASAAGGFRLLAALAALAVALLIQVGTNLYNDYADFQRGTDTADRLGPLRVTQAGLLSPLAVRGGALLAFGLAGVAGLYLVWQSGWVAALLGLAAILAGLAYTAGPWPLAYNGLGDLFAWIFFGFVAVGGTTYVQLGRMSGLAWGGGAALGALITALLVVNNVRDEATDRAAGRRTLPVVFGRKAGLWEYRLCLLAAYTVPPVLALLYRQPLHLLPWLSAAEAVRLVRALDRTRGAGLNRVLGGTARLVLWFGMLMSLGFLLA